ncbi:MAG: 50S ribosomal protein L11 [Actinobacteria bacterium]|nr:50S ribosomal protein L11 [Actinomycetota bacterium]
MARQIKAVVKLQLAAGQATPAPPVGPALGGHGVNIVEFTKQYNERTREQVGSVIPVEITVFDDRSFTFVTKTPPVSDLLRKAAGVAKGSGKPRTDFVGAITAQQVREIARIKLPDLNAHDLDAAEHMIRGTARSMGITVEG